jgi:hypothetical protein
MMEDTIYNLFLTSEQGWSLYGTMRLRIRFDDGSAAMPPLVSALPQPLTQLVQPNPVEGDISIPLLTLFRRVPLRGLAYGTAAGLFSIVVDSGAAWPRLGLQLFFLGGEDLCGPLVWGASNFNDSAFSVLARQLPAQS